MDKIVIELEGLMWEEVAMIYNIATTAVQGVCTATHAKGVRWNIGINNDLPLPYAKERAGADRELLNARIADPITS